MPLAAKDFRRFVVFGLSSLLGWQMAIAEEAPPRPADRAASVRVLCERLGLGEGRVVADIGCGNGGDSVVFAAVVGPRGVVFAEEIDPPRLRDVLKRSEARGKEEIAVAVKSVEFPPELVPEETWRRIGIEVMANSRKTAAEYGLYTSEGMVLAKVRRQSPAAQIGLRPGDVVVRIDRFDITSASSFERAVSDALRRGWGAFLVQRGPSVYYLTLSF